MTHITINRTPMPDEDAMAEDVNRVSVRFGLPVVLFCVAPVSVDRDLNFAQYKVRGSGGGVDLIDKIGLYSVAQKMLETTATQFEGDPCPCDRCADTKARIAGALAILKGP